MRHIATFLAALLISTSLALAIDFSKHNPPDCPKGPDGKAKYRCLTVDEWAEVTEEYLTLKARVDKLDWQRHTFGHYVEPWATVGMERLPNEGVMHPYGLAGVNIGRVSVWGGSFGDSPAYGIGWRIWPK